MPVSYTHLDVYKRQGSNREFLLSEGMESTEAFVALTNIDEENVLLTLFAKKHSKGKLVTKVNRLECDDILAGLDLGSVVYPKSVSYTHLRTTSVQTALQMAPTLITRSSPPL